MNGEHMVTGSEENKRQDFTVNSIQGRELTMTEFECGTWFPGISEVVWGWWKWVLESRMGQKLISMSLWVLWDITTSLITPMLSSTLELIKPQSIAVIAPR